MDGSHHVTALDLTARVAEGRLQLERLREAVTAIGADAFGGPTMTPDQHDEAAIEMHSENGSPERRAAITDLIVLDEKLTAAWVHLDALRALLA